MAERRRRFAVVWALLVAFSLLAHGQAADAQETANLIKNGGFEDGKTAWRLVGAEIDATVAHQGRQAAKITGDGAGYQGVLYNPPGQFSVEPACKYEIRLWARVQKDGGWLKARVRQRKGAEATGKEYGFLPSDSADWKGWSFEFITGLETDNILLDFYFINTKGVAYVDDVSLRKVSALEPVTSEKLTQDLRSKLTKAGFKLRQEREHLVAEKEGLRTHYRLITGKTYVLPDEWEKEAALGSEVDKLSYLMEHFPIGPAVYGYALYARAQQLGMDKWEYMAKAFEDIKAHHMNTVWFGNTGSDKEDIDRVVALAEQKGLRLLLQMSGAYYRCTEPEYRDNADKRRRHYEEVNVPFVRDVMPKYRGRKGVFAWSVKEETRAEYAKELADYYKLVMELDPTHPILICHNNLAAAESMEEPYPSIIGFDRYFYRCSFSGGGYLRTPALAVSALEEDLPPFYQASLRYRVPFFFVLQGVASYVKGVDFSREGTVGANMLPRGWRQDPGANTWSGWLRYYPPKHCMKLQVWAPVALGAKGLFGYLYGEPTWGKLKPDMTKAAELGLSCDPSGQPAPQWAEFADAAKDILHFAPLLLRMNKRVRNLGACDDPNVLVSTFQEEDSGRRYLIVVNKRTGFWCKDSPKSLKPEDELSVDSHGQLAGYRPAPALEFVLKVETEQSLYDLRTLMKLPPTSSSAGARSYRITLPPGEGNVLLLGADADLLECRKLLLDVRS